MLTMDFFDTFETQTSRQSTSLAVPKRLTPSRRVFGDEIVGCLVDIAYPDGIGRFVCRVTDYVPEFGWHKVESVACSTDRSLNLQTGQLEEQFVDEIDVNTFWKDRRIQFIGPDDDPYTFCPVCKWQAAPTVSCLTCADCKYRAHTRCAAFFRPGRKPSCQVDCDDSFHLVPSGPDQIWVCPQCKSESTSTSTPLQTPAKRDEPTAKRFRLSPSKLTLHSEYDELRMFSEEIVSEIALEFFETVQKAGHSRRFRFVSGPEFLNRVCGGNVNHALTALQHSATGGVLTWQCGDTESENMKLLRRGLDSRDKSVELIVALLEVSPCSQAKVSAHSKPPTAATCCQQTFGFAVVSGLRTGAQTGDDNRHKFAQVLVFAARSSHCRSLEEMVAVLTERQWSHWSVLDTNDGQLIDYCTEQLAESQSFLEYTTVSLDEATPSTQRILDSVYLYQGVHTRHTASSSEVKKICRADFDPKRFLLVHRGQAVDYLAHDFIFAPSRLTLGCALRLLQSLGYRVCLLELALPIAGPVPRRGHGRRVLKVTGINGLRSCKALISNDNPSLWPPTLPQMGDYTLDTTANASAYKTYRAFGLGEHVSWSRLDVNNHCQYLYPVLGCVLDQNNTGGVTAEKIRQLSVRGISSLNGIAGWLDTVDKRSSDIRAISELVKFDTRTCSVDDASEMRELQFFESILDRTSPNQLGVSYSGKAPQTKRSSWTVALQEEPRDGRPRRSTRLAKVTRS